MFDDFSHFLSFSATDQQTARDLSGHYDGLLVPGTIASAQADGTKGFVLTLSATSHSPRYVVDPRFPLFQQSLPSPKQVHRALADVLGMPSLVQPESPIAPDGYSDQVVQQITDNWLDFNRGFTDSTALKKFDKYASRLDEPIIPANRKGPSWILPPYFVIQADDPRWTPVSERLWRCASERARVPASLVRVIAVDQADLLDEVLVSCTENRLAVWVSGLDERQVDPAGQANLVAYGRAIQDARARGKLLFALYGGFFSVLLSMFGLSGSSHGIGYGEARAWKELPHSGPPPPRYYLAKAHRYVNRDLALFLWQEDRSLVVCECAECQGDSPGLLDYHALMRHSVRCRAEEVRHWAHMSPDNAIAELTLDAEMFEDAVAALNIPAGLRRGAEECFATLRGWAAAIGAIGI